MLEQGSGNQIINGTKFKIFVKISHTTIKIESQNSLTWKEPFKGHLVQTSLQTRLLRALSCLTLTVSWDGTSTISLGNLCQGFTTLNVKISFFYVI